MLNFILRISVFTDPLTVTQDIKMLISESSLIDRSKQPINTNFLFNFYWSMTPQTIGTRKKGKKQ